MQQCCSPGLDFSPLILATKLCYTYKTLSKLALDLVSTPASEAYAEKDFSVRGQLITGMSNRKSTKLERRVFLKVNFGIVIHI